MPHRPSLYCAARSRHTAGFTLAELLAVVAIVAVLVAAAIPVFTGAPGNTEEATCAANRRSVKSMYTTAWLLGQNPGSRQTLFGNCAAQLKSRTTTCSARERARIPPRSRKTVPSSSNAASTERAWTTI